MSIEIAYNDLERYAVVDKNVIMDVSLSCEARLLYVYLVSHGKGWKIQRSVLVEYLGSDHRVRKATGELKEAGLVEITKQYDEKTRKILSDKWRIFSATNRSPHVDNPHVDPGLDKQEKSTCMPDPHEAQNHMRELPTCGDSPRVAQTTCIKNTKGFKNTDLLKNPNPMPENEKPTPAKKTKAPKSIPTYRPEDFERFWRAYPDGYRQERPEAVAAWDDMQLDDETIEAIVADIEARKASYPKWRPDPRDGKTFIPAPHRYLRKGRWTDEWRVKGGLPALPAAPVALTKQQQIRASNQAVIDSFRNKSQDGRVHGL